ncbi:hypothetical protein IAU59_003740 [Kwoniella sp. CBS 9459]
MIATHPAKEACSSLSPILPLDVLLHLRDVLIYTQQKATAVKMMASSQAFYEIFLPVLAYDKLELRASLGGASVFSGLMDSESKTIDRQPTGHPGAGAQRHDYDSPGLRLRIRSRNALKFALILCTQSCPANGSPIPSFLPSIRSSHSSFPTEATHYRKLSLLETCTNLTIRDLPSAINLIQTQTATGRTPLFPNLEELVLGSDLIATIIMEIDRGSIRQVSSLPHILRPRHLCLWYPRIRGRALYPAGHNALTSPYPISSTNDIDSSVSDTDEQSPFLNLDEDMYYEADHLASLKYGSRWYSTLNHLLESFGSALRPLDSVNFHNPYGHSLPHVHTIRYRISFVSTVGFSQGQHISVDSALSRATQIIGLLQWRSPSQDQKFEIVGADMLIDVPRHRRSKWLGFPTTKIKSTETHVREFLAAQWGQEAVDKVLSFVDEEEASGCICCGHS